MRLGDDIYPCTITRDRYGGVYSGGTWTAWPLYINEIPPNMEASDIPCVDFWVCYIGRVGKGDTPDEAYADLLSQVP